MYLLSVPFVLKTPDHLMLQPGATFPHFKQLIEGFITCPHDAGHGSSRFTGVILFTLKVILINE
jgi:hypothetical protein